MRFILYQIVISSLLVCLSSCNPNSNILSHDETGIFKRSLESFTGLYDYLDSLRVSTETSALQVAVIRPDTTVVWSFGEASDSSMFRLGSVSKSFAGLSLLKLVEQGFLSLNDNLTEIAPEVPVENPFKNDHPVQLAHLLESSAGFLGFHESDYEPDPNITDYAEIICNNPYPFKVQWEPGLYTAYHNIGPTITAYIVETITGQKYEDFVSQNFFIPLEMNNSTFLLSPEVEKLLVNYEAESYEHIKPRPSGSLNSSAKEFVNFVKMLINDGAHRSGTGFIQ